MTSDEELKLDLFRKVLSGAIDGELLVRPPAEELKAQLRSSSLSFLQEVLNLLLPREEYELCAAVKVLIEESHLR